MNTPGSQKPAPLLPKAQAHRQIVSFRSTRKKSEPLAQSSPYRSRKSVEQSHTKPACVAMSSAAPPSSKAELRTSCNDSDFSWLSTQSRSLPDPYSYGIELAPHIVGCTNLLKILNRFTTNSPLACLQLVSTWEF